MERRFYILVFFFFLLIFLTTMDGYFFIPDATSSFKTAKAIIEKGRLDVDLTEKTELNLVGDSENYKGTYTYFRNKDGKIYSRYGIGLSLFMIPFVLLGKFLYLICGLTLGVDREFFENFCVSSMNSFSAALACLVLIKFARRMGFSHKTSFILSILFGLGTMVWFYANSTYSESLVMCELLCALYFIFKQLQTKKISDIALAGLFAGLMLITKIGTFILFPILIAYVIYNSVRQKDIKPIIAFSSISIVFILLIFYLNFVQFGSIFETGYSDVLSVTFSGNKPISVFILISIYRYLISPQKGLFVYNPILLVSIFSLAQFYKRQRGFFYVTLGMFVTYIVALSRSIHLLIISWGPRYLLILIPYLVLPIGYLIEKRKKIVYIFAMFLFAISFFINLESVLVSHNQYTVMKLKLLQNDINPPPDIIGMFTQLKNKVTKKDDVYLASDFGKKGPDGSKVIIKFQSDAYRGLNLWYLYLEWKTGRKAAKLFPILSLPIIMVLLFKIFHSAKRLDEGVY